MPVSEGVISALIELKRTDDGALVAQLTSQLRGLISSGRLGKGRALPSSRRLASDLGVSRNTVTYAFEQLAAEGYLEASHGRRPVVTVDGGGRVEGAGAVASGARPGKPRLSPWASKLKQTDWPMSYQAPLKPLRPGHGDVREFPNELWARCLRRSAMQAARREPGSVNRSSLREALAHYLATSRGVRATADQIVILPSAQAALTLIAAAIITPGDEVWVEDPGYPGAAAAFRASGARLAGIALDEQGMQRMPGRVAPTLIFMTPSHQHPTGRLMSLARRTELLRLSRPGKTWIVEDDYDGEFHYDSRPVPALQGLDAHGRVFYVGTFSKAMTSDIRLGYLVVPPALVSTFEIAQRHIGLIAACHVQEALAEFIADGHFLAHLRRVRRLYHARRDHLAAGLERQLGEVLSVEVPSGGIQLVARLKRGRADQAAVERLGAAGVVTRALSSLALDRPRDHGLLLGFAAWRENEISAAVKTMASCF
ncbi:MocR-like pyridoxine biosynthesis transcription factor PdxR [Bradyrhizobium betae]|uniref:PLP-dependent aminotransferase family protein n=1 Tax=Bradyrhizobium betae TaxID=244734 RepID=A0A5P6P0L2_9BRAD|nr:PLP-dependent aminotransferase family protein [Bradyrhizobium betae]MCS3728113.1 GntR family transcriptional regulator/MocR family aminotransferase [Bradyrhizobium betae]QFI71897.1 PLP-dependent aminotransferase family protein [Bradyrhizobium betae]